MKSTRSRIVIRRGGPARRAFRYLYAKPGAQQSLPILAPSDPISLVDPTNPRAKGRQVGRKRIVTLAAALAALALAIPPAVAQVDLPVTAGPGYSGAVVPSLDEGARKDVDARRADGVQIRPELKAALADASAGERLVVLVSGRRASTVRRATVAAGLGVIEVFRRVGVVVAVGTPIEIRRLHLDSGIDGIYLPSPMRPASDSALVAT